MDDFPLIMVSSDLDRPMAGALRSRWVAIPGMATRNPALLGGRDKPGHDGLVGMGAPDKEPARRRRSE
jgi:hypothetical protein